MEAGGEWDLTITVVYEPLSPFLNIGVFKEVLYENVTILFVEVTLLEGQTTIIASISELWMELAVYILEPLHPIM